MNQQISELAKHGIEAFAFILPFNVRVSAEDFAAMIRKHSSDPRAAACAAEIHKTGLSFARDRRREALSMHSR